MVIYLNTVPMPDGAIHDRDTSMQAAHYSLYQIQVDTQAPKKVILLPAPGADPQLLSGYHQVLRPAFNVKGVPQPGVPFGPTWQLFTKLDQKHNLLPTNALTL